MALCKGCGRVEVYAPIGVCGRCVRRTREAARALRPVRADAREPLLGGVVVRRDGDLLFWAVVLFAAALLLFGVWFCPVEWFQ